MAGARTPAGCPRERRATTADRRLNGIVHCIAIVGKSEVIGGTGGDGLGREPVRERCAGREQHGRRVRRWTLRFLSSPFDKRNLQLGSEQRPELAERIREGDDHEHGVRRLHDDGR